MDELTQRGHSAEPGSMEAVMQQLLMDNNRSESFDSAFDLPRFPLSRAASEPSPRPLWLTAEEADLLVTLCFAAPSTGGETEAEFFGKLGRFVRSFAL
ncbi:MAG: hypothetical protein ACO1SX_18025 [Actinomycetota bacterium]